MLDIVFLELNTAPGIEMLISRTNWSIASSCLLVCPKQLVAMLGIKSAKESFARTVWYACVWLLEETCDMQNVRLQQLDCIITITLFHQKLLRVGYPVEQPSFRGQ